MHARSHRRLVGFACTPLFEVKRCRAEPTGGWDGGSRRSPCRSLWPGRALPTMSQGSSWRRFSVVVSSPASVGLVDLASEWLRLSAHYRGMSEGELLQIARDPSALTEAAQQTLAAELSTRGLNLPPPEPGSSPPPPEPDPDSPYAEERELVEICKVWSLSDALQLQWLLDRAGIPFYIGPDKATAVDAGPLNFGEGLSVQVMRVGLPWALQAMQDYQPANEPPHQEEEGWREIPVTCPKCRTEEVILENLTRQSVDDPDPSSARFAWTCDACGYQWEDEGMLNGV